MVTVEVCIDNAESLTAAVKGGASRIELCSALALGGLTPSAGQMQQTAHYLREYEQHSGRQIATYAMIRPRAGDFVFDRFDLQSMLADIQTAKNAGLQGVVIGALNPHALLDSAIVEPLCSKAKQLGLGVTFHRAIDLCQEPLQAIDRLIELGVERVLTSGQADHVLNGLPTIKTWQQFSGDGLSVMPGCGINAENVAQVVSATQCHEVHLSGKVLRPSAMQYRNQKPSMGSHDNQDGSVEVTCMQRIQQVVENLRAFD